MSGTFGDVTFDKFKKTAAAFLNKANSGEYDSTELDAGFKTVALMYLGIPPDSLDERNTYEAVLIMEMAGKAVTKELVRELLGDVNVT